MVYNYKYKCEWVGHKYQTYKLQNPSADDIYYRLEFYKSEAVAVTYTIEELKASNAPFVLTYNSKSDFVFEPFRPSSADIVIKLGSNSTILPEDFYTGIDNTTWKIVFKLINATDVTETELWSGFMLSSEIQYEWQDEYFLRLTVSDNIGILKEFRYSDALQFSIPTTQDIYEGLSIKDFVCRCLGYIGLNNNVKFAFNFRENMTSVNELSMFVNEYAAIEWERKYPRTIDELLSGLLTSLGCICYLDNRDNSWTILSINELATSVNNVVPYRLYDYEGTAITSGDYDIKTDIIRGTDTIWSDANQIVTLRPPYSSVWMEYEYLPKNIMPNYGFFQYSGSAPEIWSGAGTVLKNIRNPYDPYYLKWDVNESKTGGFTGNSYEEMIIDMDRFTACYDANTSTPVNLRQSFAINITFDYKIVGGTNGDGFNITPIFYRPNDGAYLSFDGSGEWYTTTFANLESSSPIRIEVYSDNNEWNKFQVLSKYTASDGTGSPSSTNWFFEMTEVRFWIRPLRVTSPSSGTPYLLIDNIQFNIIPTGFLTTNSFNFIAYNPEGVFFNENTKTIKSMFHSGYSVNKNNAFVYEDIIFVKDNIGSVNYIRSSNKWERAWESEVTEESTENYLNCKTASSIFSFYRASGRKFTGNVYAEQTPISEVVSTPFGFPVYVGIEGCLNVNENIDIQNQFAQYVTADGGVVEDTVCSADFLGEFNMNLSKFISTKATFDYFTNKTMVTLEEDLTDKIELWDETLAGGSFSNGSNFGNVGSTSGNTQTTITAG